MRYVLDFLYLSALLISSPWLIYKALTTGKYRRGLGKKFLGLAFRRRSASPCVWFHGVSVGEIHMLVPVVSGFRRRHPKWECVISTTTDTGFDEAVKKFPGLHVFFWPFDFSWAVRRSLLRVNPSLIVLAEGELWPNMLAAAKTRQVTVALINGRLSPRSYRNYRRLKPLVRGLLNSVDLFAVQTDDYAASFRSLSVPPDKIHVTGSVKYDGANLDPFNPRTEELRRWLRVQPGDLVWIAGSTQAPEEEITLSIFRGARSDFPQLRLFLVPRQKDRFEEVACLLERSGLPFIRRSSLAGPVPDRDAIVLMDTIGELSALWGLADVAYVGGSLDGRRGGQNMIEPAAYGAAVVFGPHVWNFRETAARLTAAGAAIQVADAAELQRVVLELLNDKSKRRQLGHVGREFVRAQQGATERTLDCLDRLPTVISPQKCAA
jgi:3-deoxy-D-manno-octulosonic-acid transferase